MVDITITEVNASDFEVLAEVDGETKRYVFGLSQWGGNTFLRDAIANIEFRDTSGDYVEPTPSPVATVEPMTFDNLLNPATNKNSEVL